MKKIIISFVSLLLFCSIGVCNNKQNLQSMMDEVLKSDPRNEGIKASVYSKENQSVLFFNLENISLDKSPADVFRVFLQFADKIKENVYKTVKLCFRKKVKFIIDGKYFQKIGKEFSFQNPVYTMRTFPKNLLNPDGTKAYNTWTGGLIGVLNKQMEDFNDFHKKWYLDELLSEVTYKTTKKERELN